MSHFRTIIVHNAVYTNMDYLRFKDTLFQSQFDKMQSLVAPWKYLNAVLTCATLDGINFQEDYFSRGFIFEDREMFIISSDLFSQKPNMYFFLLIL